MESDCENYRDLTQTVGFSNCVREMTLPVPVNRIRLSPGFDPFSYREFTHVCRLFTVIPPRERATNLSVLKPNSDRNFRSNYDQNQKSRRTFFFEDRGGEGW